MILSTDISGLCKHVLLFWANIFLDLLQLNKKLLVEITLKFLNIFLQLVNFEVLSISPIVVMLFNKTC